MRQSECLEPQLTALDERVLNHLPGSQPGVRADVIAKRLVSRHANPHPNLTREVRLILRGFEHLGKATGRGGWWRRTA